MAERSGIVVAAGRGERFGSDEPKAFMLLAGLPLFAHAAAALQQGGVEEVCVVVPSGMEPQAGAWLEKVAGLRWQVTTGGATRSASVRAGLRETSADRVAVHDAARPLAGGELVARVLTALEPPWSAAAPGLPVADTLKQVEGDQVVRTVSREGLWAVQTPQVFRRAVLEAAHRQPDADATDDLALVERLGEPVRLVLGERRNFKITFPADLAMAEQLLGSRR